MIAAVLDHLWQSTLFGGAAALLALTIRRNAARIRYWVWFAATAKFLVPFAPIAAAAAWTAGRLHARAPAPFRLEAARRVLEPAATAEIPTAAPAAALLHLAPILLATWLIGSSAILVLRAAQWRALQRALGAADPAPLTPGLRTVVAPLAGSPAVIGFLRPILVLPPGLAERLSPGELQAVLAHEAQHARRRDNLLALAPLLAQTLFWFHPLVWWLKARMFAEREQACDEAVLAGGADAKTYAQGLLKACRLGLEAPLGAAGVGGADLSQRIQRIMTAAPPPPLGPIRRLALSGALAMAIAAPVAAGVWSEPLRRLPVEAIRTLLASARLPRPQAALPVETPAPEPEAIAAHAVKVRIAPPQAVLAQAPNLAPAPPYRLALSGRPPLLERLSGAAAEAEAPVHEPAPAPSAQSSAFAQALADHSAVVVSADVLRAGLAVRPATATAGLRPCPALRLSPAEDHMAISTQFDGAVRRFVERAAAGAPDRQDLTPALARALDGSLPALKASLDHHFEGDAPVRLVGSDSLGRDVYLVGRRGGDYALVRVDDLGRIAAALFCTAG